MRNLFEFKKKSEVFCFTSKASFSKIPKQPGEVP